MLFRSVNRVTVRNGDRMNVVLYWYHSSSGAVANEYWAKIRLISDAIFRGRSDTALVRVTVPVNGIDEQAAENADATTFLEALLFRRYEAKLRYELGFWTRFPEEGGSPEGYEEFLTAATGIRYRSDQYLSDMDSGFYSSDYLRAWIRSAQLRAHLIATVGEDWWRNPATGELLTELFREGKIGRAHV